MNETERAITLISKGEIDFSGIYDDGLNKKISKTILAALREKQERDKGCEYCSDHEDLAFGHDSLKRVGSIYIDKNLLVADLYSESMAVVICFCPVCGKRLEEYHEDD